MKSEVPLGTWHSPTGRILDVTMVVAIELDVASYLPGDRLTSSVPPDERVWFLDDVMPEVTRRMRAELGRVQVRIGRWIERPRPAPEDDEAINGGDR